MSCEVIEAYVVIFLPKFKTHGLAVITGAIKNSYGILAGARRPCCTDIRRNSEVS